MKKILIVEDQEDTREIIRLTLELEDFELYQASNGQEALAVLSRLKPDLVISDVMMPQLDGLALCQRIKNDPALKRTKVVLLSAKGQRADCQAGVMAGADAYLVKPYSPLELLATVQRMIG